MKRVWRTAQARAEASGWGIALDGRPLRVPSGPPLVVPSAGLAEDIAAEWREAGAASGEMTYADVPLTRLAGTAQMRILPDPDPAIGAIAAYGETDLLCYRADRPPELAARQDEAWRPWLDWARKDLGAALTVTMGVMHVRQHPNATAALRQAVAETDGWRLAALGVIVPALGSLVLGLAMLRGRLAAAPAFRLANVDEEYQMELWGEDAEAADRRTRILAELEDCARYLAALS